QGIHEAYLKAGADLIETNTFGATSVVLADYDIPERAREINLVAAKLARNAVDKYSTADKPRFVVGAMGPTTKTLSVTGGVTFAELI
ncbi:homocysteine S-methyltransferase family protein, partial [Paenibacillus sp. EKM208P]